MDKERLFQASASCKDDETFYDRIARRRRLQKAAVERVARRYANIKPKKQGRWPQKAGQMAHGRLRRPGDRETSGFVR